MNRDERHEDPRADERAGPAAGEGLAASLDLDRREATMAPEPPWPGAAHPSATTATIEPLPGEAGIPDVALARTSRTSRKAIVAIGLLAASLVTAAVLTVQRYTAGKFRKEETSDTRNANRPAAAMTAPKRLELPGMPPPVTAAASSAAPAGTSESGTTPGGTRVPALQTAGSTEMGAGATPIPVRPNGTGSTLAGSPATSAGPKPMAPEDAPVMLVSTKPVTHGAAQRFEPVALPSGTADAGPAGGNDALAATRRNLDAYQRQLQGLLETLGRTTALAADGGGMGVVPAASGGGGPPMSLPALPTALRVPGQDATSPPAAAGGGGGGTGNGLFGGQLQGSATPRVSATLLGNRSLILPKGTAFTCALKTRVISATSGLVGCLVQRPVYSDDGRVLLVERGSHLDGEYRVASLKPGSVRIPVLWTRLRTPEGVVVDIDSPGTGPLGESGIDGHVDNRWGDRIGAALLLSLIDDSVKLVIQAQQNDAQSGNGSTIVLPSTTANASKLAEKVLESTINIPPLIYQNQGGIVGIYVARDVDFSGVYELQPVALQERAGHPGAARRQP